MDSNWILCGLVALLLYGLVTAQTMGEDGVCWAMGDPYCRMFDGGLFSVMGTCSYVLTKNNRVDNFHPAFEVIVKNSPKPSSQLTAVSRVTVKVYNYEIKMTRDNGKVWINNELWNLPATLTHSGKRIDIVQSGLSLVLSTDFSLKVHYDWKSYVKVVVPRTFMGRLRGLCGDFNGLLFQDFIKPDGSIAKKADPFVESWKVPNQKGDEGCRDRCLEDCVSCPIKKALEALIQCNRLMRALNRNFVACQGTLGAQVLIQMCNFDYCQNAMTSSSISSYICDTLQMYTDNCQEAGVRVGDWRRTEKCPAPVCPEHSRFDSCGSACPATCQNPNPTCQQSCVQTCTCEDGYILSGNKCVHRKECGCVYNGRYLYSGETIWDELCTKKITCHSEDIAIEEASCGPDKVCEVKDGVRGCHAVPSGVCTIAGDPHYTTFDGQTFDFMGTCAYVVSEYRQQIGTNLTPFSVVVANEKWVPNPLTSVAKLVAVTVYNTVVFLRRDHPGLAMVNGVNWHLPLSYNGGQIVIQQIGQNVVLSTAFGLKVTYDLVYHVTVTVPGTYATKTTGLCGNFNNNKQDDFYLKDGTITTDVTAFGNSWKVDLPGEVCEVRCIGDLCPVCTVADKVRVEADCAILTNPKGPFSQCHAYRDPSSYYLDCVYDVCAAGNMNGGQTLCDSINAYVLDCQGGGVLVSTWRTPNFCPLTCPANSEYRICGNSCDSACPGLADVACSTVCAEGCFCLPGYYFTGLSCVPMDQCGCYINGRRLQIGQSEVSEDCKYKYSCPTSGGGKAEPLHCKPDETCGVENGIRGCYRLQCTLGRAGAFRTFDGRTSVIKLGDGYDLVSYCDDRVAKGWFRITADLQFCLRNFQITVVGIFAFFDDISVIVNSKFETWINGKKVTLPYKSDNSLSVQISKKGLVIEKKSVVVVSYSHTQEISVTISNSVADKVCGACGRPSAENDLIHLLKPKALALTPIPFASCDL